MSNKKYRPMLTLSQLEYIRDRCREEASSSLIARELYMVIAPFLTKVEVGAITPAYSASPSSKISADDVMDSLGFYSPKEETMEAQNKKRRAAYKEREAVTIQEYLGGTAMEAFSEEQQQMILQYRYLNDMMDSQEEEAYQESLLSLPPSSQ
jgi:hypothetical protein